MAVTKENEQEINKCNCVVWLVYIHGSIAPLKKNQRQTIITLFAANCLLLV